MSEKQSQSRRERRRERTENSRATRREFWGARFDQADTPVDLLEQAYRLLRSRVMRLERRALGAAGRARTPEEAERTRRRVAAARQRITEICGTAAAELERLADTIDTARR